MILHSCCGILSLKQGTNIGGLYTTIEAIILFGYGVFIVEKDKSLEEGSLFHTFAEAMYITRVKYLFSSAITCFVISIIYIVVTNLLFVGVQKQQRCYIWPWQIFSALVTGVSIFLCIITLVGGNFHSSVIVFVLKVIFEFYLLFVVGSYMQKLAKYAPVPVRVQSEVRFDITPK